MLLGFDLAVINGIFISRSWDLKLSYKIQFWTLITKMRILKRFSNLAKHN